MNIQNILLDKLPAEIKQKVINEDILLFEYFMYHEVSDINYSFIISSYASDINSEKLHELAAAIFHFHFNYYEYAYEYAFYHYWKSLELSEFKNKRLLQGFLEISSEPDFDIIPEEYLRFAKEKLNDIE